MKRWDPKKKSVPGIAKFAGRHRSTLQKRVRRLACTRKVAKGRPVAITKEIYASLEKALDKVLRGAATGEEC